MRALAITIVISIWLELLCLSDARLNGTERSTRQSLLGLSPLNPFYSPIFNRSIYNGGLKHATSPYTPRFDFSHPHTVRLTPQESVTVIPNAQPHISQYSTSIPHPNLHLQAPAPLQYQQQVQYQQPIQQPEQYQPQYQQQVPFFYHQQDFPNNNIYSTPTPVPTAYSNSFFDIPAQQFTNLIDQGYFKYPVYVDPNLASTFRQTPKPMFMKRRTIQDLCAAYAPEEKTVIYVLSQNPSEPPEEIEVPKVPQPTKPSKPEVFFVKYNTPEEAEQAQKHIQAQYDALGGTSEHSNEGISPISSAQEILSGHHNFTARIITSAPPSH